MRPYVIYVLINDAGKIATVETPFVPVVPNPQDHIADFELQLMGEEFQRQVARLEQDGYGISNWHIAVREEQSPLREGESIQVIVNHLLSGTATITFE